MKKEAMPLATKVTDKHFIDWESHVFGYGYGTGEEATLPALKRFFEILENCRSYDYRRMEQEFGALATWLLINTLVRADLIDYGTSTRHRWLTGKGELLRDYVLGKSVDQLFEVIMSTDEDYIWCFPHRCQCVDEPCNNPLFSKRSANNFSSGNRL